MVSAKSSGNEREMGEMNDFETLRDMYLTGKLWNVGDLVEANGVEARIIRKSTNYIAFNDSTGKVHKAWLHEIELNEEVELDEELPLFLALWGTGARRRYGATHALPDRACFRDYCGTARRRCASP